MRTDGELRQKLKQVIFRHLQRGLRHLMARHPESCRHNGEVSISGSRERVGVCRCKMEGSNLFGMICDSRVGGCAAKARQCPFWLPAQDPDLFRLEFKAKILKASREQIASDFADVAALLWALNEYDLTQDQAELTTAAQAALLESGVQDGAPCEEVCDL